MEEIKIVFFIVATFFGVNQSNVFSEKTTVTINPEEKNITILQENLISILLNESDSLQVKTELEKISQPNHLWSSEFKNYSRKEKEFYIDEDTQSLNLKLTLTYTSTHDLKAFGIDLNKDGKLSMMNFPKSHITSNEGTLGERYWNFEANKPFSFTLEPLKDIPETYKVYKTSVLPFWKTLKH